MTENKLTDNDLRFLDFEADAIFFELLSDRLGRSCTAEDILHEEDRLERAPYENPRTGERGHVFPGSFLTDLRMGPPVCDGWLGDGEPCGRCAPCEEVACPECGSPVGCEADCPSLEEPRAFESEAERLG